MKYLRTAVFFIVVLLAQSAVFSRLSVLGARMDLVLLFVVVFGIMAGAEKGLAIGVLAGICQDMLYGTGYYFLLGMGFAGFISGAIKGAIIIDDTVTLSAIAFVSIIFYHLFYALIFQYLFTREIHGLSIGLFAGALANALLAPVFIDAYKKIFENG